MKKYNITEYGAKPDGTICTAAIQRAIDLCEKDGTVYVPEGTFVTGALFLKSNMTLFLEEGAKLMGSGNIEDYPLMGCPYEGIEQLCYASLICTDGAPHKNITIEGKGVIDANGVALFKREMSENKGKRGRAVCIRNTENLTIKGVTLRQSPAWCLHIVYCSNVLIDDVEVHSKYDENGNKYDICNCDGIDVDACRNVVITNSLISSQDDCIAIKSGKNEEGRRVGVPSQNVTVENCVFKSGFGVAVGSEMSGGVSGVFVRNCTFENTHSIASIKAIRGRGAYVKNIHYENCSLVNRSTEYSDTRWFRGAIYADGFYGDIEFDADTPVKIDEGTPVVDGVYFKDITVDTSAGNAVYLYGLPELPFKNIYLENVRAHGKYGMKVKNIDNLQLINTEVTSDEDFIKG
ncbi:MAG: glycoside hydrolase family 28 protein [bacterium]|nr:glycoside hydrolase family 28 protein [bacterium]